MMKELREMRVEQGSKWLRGYARGELVFDTTRPVLVWEVPYFPTYYIPETDVEAGLVATGDVKRSSRRGEGEILDVKLNRDSLDGAALRFPGSPMEELRGLVRFEWSALDEWLEEDEPVYTHARDPYTRVEILRSSRHIEVVVEGVKIADTHSPTILFETNLPTRYYLPIGDVQTEVLHPSRSQTHCPYKGTASYFSAEVNGKTYEDLLWIYRAPLPESQKIAGLVSFYNEKVDIYVDGELQPRPKTKFS